ncbi:General secretory system II protein E domain protein [Enhygromyxa salina]|uniref:General secretory system II protein E domain protein n=1 Tax=Enhygromyxa salina TaxID=215803 RepID=A0A0C1ZLX1_9BACT|nr:class I SAM-dependent methyltransferase [Enhygromyxa salina]KIG11823.1 General secretory system II protein E domain protein [Enhygromyxa salina]
MREQKLARVIDREVAPIWHDRFARLLMRELPSAPETFALDIHSGAGHTTAELLQRLDESSRIVALGRDPWLMQVSKTRVRPEWKRRVYFKSGDIDDVTDMNDDTYDLAIANLVLGEQVVEWLPALAELIRVTKPGGQVLATLPLSGTWREVEDMFEEVLRDEDMRREVATLQMLRRRRPTPSQLVAGLQSIGLTEQDFVVEHEHFELLFRSGREFLFAPVIEHGPLRLWKAIIGRAEKPQALFWRFKEAIDTYYAGHVLAVNVVAGLVRVRVPGGPADNFSSSYWRRYPTLAKLWGGLGGEPDAGEASEEDFEFDLDIDLDEADAAIDALTDEPDTAADDGTQFPESLDEIGTVGFADAGRGFTDMEVSGANELPAIEDVALGGDADDMFAGLLEELDAEEAAAAEIAAEDAEVEAAVQPRKHQSSGRAATLGAVEHSPLPGKLPRKPGESGVSPIPPGSRSTGSGPAATAKPIARVPLASRLPGRNPGESGTGPIPGKLPPAPKLGEKLPPRPPGGNGGSLASRLPRRTGSGIHPLPPIPSPSGTSLAAPGEARRTPTDTKALLARLGKRGDTQSGVKPLPRPPVGPPPSIASPPAATPPPPRVTKPGEEDPFASMEEDMDEFEEIDDLESSLVGGEIDEDDDFADSFGNVSPDPSAGRSGSRPIPPPPPGRKKTK